jgi:hypothetical protein
MFDFILFCYYLVDSTDRRLGWRGWKEGIWGDGGGGGGERKDRKNEVEKAKSQSMSDSP